MKTYEQLEMEIEDQQRKDGLSEELIAHSRACRMTLKKILDAAKEAGAQSIEVPYNKVAACFPAL